MKKAIGTIGLVTASFTLGVIGAFQVPKQKSIWDIWQDAFTWGYRCRQIQEQSSDAAKHYYKAFKSYVNIMTKGL